MQIAIIDYGMGNLHSVLKSTQKAQQLSNQTAKVFLTDKAQDVYQADKVIFPGQGAMPDCMKSLQNSGLAEAILDAFKNKPFLGICVGAQLLFDSSEEGNTPGLAWFAGKVVKFKSPLFDHAGNKLKVPHMGWNQVHQVKKHPLFKDIEQDSRFYFVHSYHFQPEEQNISLATTDYPDDFSCIIGQDNIFATQFHVEKSHDNGLKMMRNFILWDGEV